ncbi:MAG TPA: universal stress protein, partial [Trueperaceae bacterium]
GAVSLPVARFSDEMRQVLESQGELVLSRVRDQAESAGIHCHTELRNGVPATEIVEAAQDQDLIVLGRSGESSQVEERRGLGAVAERVLRSSEKPVFVAPDWFQEPKRILLGYDGSERAQAAMRFAAELARSLALPLTAVSVSDDHDVALRRLEEVARHAETHDLRVERLALTGDPAAALLDAATEGDLIAMGSFGEGRIREWFLGSTTEAVLRHARQPVLLHR